MRRSRKALAGFLFVAALAGWSFLTTPRLRKPTRAEVEALLPASLKQVDPVDGPAQARYALLIEILGRIQPNGPSGTAIPEVAALLDEGPLQAPAVRQGEKVGTLKAKSLFIELLGRDGKQAIALREPARAARDATLGFRFGDALLRSSGDAIDAMVASMIDRQAALNAYEFETGGGLDARGRAALLDALPPEDGTSPALAVALRKEFRSFTVPVLLDPEPFMKNRATSERGKEPVKGEVTGSYDPIATTRLLVQIYDGAMANAARPYASRDRTPTSLVRRASDGLPKLQDLTSTEGLDRVVARTRYRLAMNWTPNSVGRTIASTSAVPFVESLAARRAAFRNLARAVLLLRTGQPVRLPDPFGGGSLRVDPKRRLVWSVGADGVDDGGLIAGGGTEASKDLGFHY